METHEIAILIIFLGLPLGMGILGYMLTWIAYR